MTTDPSTLPTTVARHQEDVVVGDKVIRHRASSRLIHWAVALSFILALITGMPIWSPVFTWMAWLVGGLHVCRWLHPWAGAGFALFSVFMFIHWAAAMVLDAHEREWLSPAKVIKYLMQQDDDQETGKYNGGQKMYFWGVSVGAVVLFLTGFVLWFPQYWGQMVRESSIVLHDLSFVAFAVSLVGHIYLGTAAGPGTFGAITRGTVTLAWAKLHHPRWYREVTGSERPRS